MLRQGGAVKIRLTGMPPVAARRWPSRRVSMAGLAAALDAAAANPLVRGLFVSLDGFSAGSADHYELASLLERYKKSGKPLHVFIERADWRSLISGRWADRLTVDALGPVMVHGIGVEMPFFGGLLERYGIEVQASQRGEYKGAVEPFVRREPSAPLAESLQALVDSLFEQAARELARRPEADVARARAALDEGPYTATQAIARCLVDAAGTAEEAEDALAAACQGGNAAPATARTRTPRKGARASEPLRQLPGLRRAGVVRPAPLAFARARRIAFVPVSGLILDRPLGGFRHQAAIATELAPVIRRLADARSVEAIVLSIDSRGGTVTASDAIWSAARYALGKKPVVAWMRGYAASGGYYVAAAAEAIVASPFTLTGSIGVIASKPSVAEAAAQLGVRPAAITRGRSALLYSPFRRFSESELAWLDAYLDESYARFKAIVAEGRRMTAEAVEEVARGRVWTGAQAHERGLVDRLGAFPDVVAVARELAGLAASVRHEILWAAPRGGPLQLARRMTAVPAASLLPAEIEMLAEPLILARQGGALYYLPPVWS